MLQCSPFAKVSLKRPRHQHGSGIASTMFCLRSWLCLLFIPSDASPAFIFTFLVCTYLINRPCVYCSFLLIILFTTSCNWSDHCFIDFSGHWFQPRTFTLSENALNSTCSAASAASNVNATATAGACASCTGSHADLSELGGDIKAAATMVANMVSSAMPTAVSTAGEKLARSNQEWTGLGFGWLRRLLGTTEWFVEGFGVYVRL